MERVPLCANNKSESNIWIVEWRSHDRLNYKFEDTGGSTFQSYLIRYLLNLQLLWIWQKQRGQGGQRSWASPWKRTTRFLHYYSQRKNTTTQIRTAFVNFKVQPLTPPTPPLLPFLNHLSTNPPSLFLFFADEAFLNTNPWLHLARTML